tara:strand:- start:718 stop:1224 length:507 start_codon:yes stop_codon:yes gene_type:complete
MALYSNVNRKKTEVFGVKELENMFKTLPKQLSEDKIWNTFWREQSKPLVKQAGINANKLDGTGQLAKSIKYFRTRYSKKAHGGLVGPRTKGAFADKEKSGYYGAWVEYGSEVKFWNKGYGKDQPYFATAFEQTKNIIMANSLKNGLKTMDKLIKSHAKRTKKYGILGA